MFESINELEQFSFEDCQIVETECFDDKIVFTLEALIVKARNTQNSNYTESYADTATLELNGASISSMIVEGYKKYDANDKLIDVTPDTLVEESAYKETLTKMVNGFLFGVEVIEKSEGFFKYSFEVDMDLPNEYGLQDPYCTTYQMDISFKESRISWERYLNRVQK